MESLSLPLKVRPLLSPSHSHPQAIMFAYRVLNAIHMCLPNFSVQPGPPPDP